MSLDLDERQRAMLKEMGVTVWWPNAQPADAKPMPAATIEVLNKSSKNNNNSEKNDIKSINNGLNSIAKNQINTWDNTEKYINENAENKYITRFTSLENLNWPALQQTVAQCRACALCEGRTQTVFGAGQTPANDEAAPVVDWLIVGEAPGENEDRVGEPFVGQAGQLLDNMLKAMQLTRQPRTPEATLANGATRGVYIANVIKCRPPGNRNPSAQEVAQCEPYLHRQIALLQPKIILAMGKFAATSLLRATMPDIDKTPLGRLRGQVHTYAHEGLSIPVVATYHPAYLLRSLTEKAKSWEDLCLAMDALAQREATRG